MLQLMRYLPLVLMVVMATAMLVGCDGGLDIHISKP